MRVARAAFFAGPALLLVAALVWSASFVADRRHARRRLVVDDEDADTPAPAPRRGMPPRRMEGWVAPPDPAPPPEPPGTLRLRVDGPHGLRVRAVSITLSPARDDGDDGESTTYGVEAEADGTFAIDELDPGRYDVTVEAEGLADAHLGGVPSGAVGVRVALARPPVLIGAVGGGDDGCADQSLLLGEGDEIGEAALDADCSFSVENLERGKSFRLAVRGDGQRAEAAVDVPTEGDPPPLCLGPPCAYLPSALVVLVSDGEGFLAGDVDYAWDTLSENGGRGGVTRRPGPLVIGDLAPGAKVHVHATRGRQSVDAEMTVSFGITEQVLTLQDGAPPED